MKHVAILVALTLTGCAAHQGAFVGDVVAPSAAPRESAAFLWAARGSSRSGKLESALADGEGFTGSYVELQDTTYPESILDLYDDWYDGWTGAVQRGWPRYEIHEYIRVYSQRVVAVLTGDRGGRMRCAFDLANPSEGMSSGGRGRCQLSDGTVIAAHFDAANTQHTVRARIDRW